MKKRTAVYITIVLLIVFTALIFLKNSCYYQMHQVKTNAYLDVDTCNIEGLPLKFRIENTGDYDLLQYGFVLAAYSRAEQDRVSHDAYTMHRRILKESSIEGCFPVPEMGALPLTTVQEQFYFKLKLFIAVFDQGNGNRRTCR